MLRAVLAACALLVSASLAGAPGLGGFYIVSEWPGRVEVLEAAQVGQDTIVRLIRISRGSPVAAAERWLRRTPPAFLAGESNPCGAAWRGDGGPSGVVARCGGREVVVRASRHALRLAEAAKAIAFNEGDPLSGLSPAEQAAAERLGRSLIPLLESGRFDRARSGPSLRALLP